MTRLIVNCENEKLTKIVKIKKQTKPITKYYTEKLKKKMNFLLG